MLETSAEPALPLSDSPGAASIARPLAALYSGVQRQQLPPKTAAMLLTSASLPFDTEKSFNWEKDR